MNLTIFQSDKGDCLLLSGTDGKRMLIDGGMASSYTQHVASTLEALQNHKQKIDLVYVSHIDDDHISGVLQMLDDLAEWVLYDHHVGKGDTDFRKPKSLRPPKPGMIWHNSFRDTVEDNDGQIADMLAARATILSGAERRKFLEIGNESRNLAYGAASALRVSRRIGPNQLGIPLNPQFGGKLMYLRKQNMPPPIQLGGMKLLVLAPREEDLGNLRKEWNKWLKAHRNAIKDIRKEAKTYEGELASSEIGRVLQPMLAQANALGNRKGVTPPNLASLMLLAEEGNKTILLTGDGFADDVTNGLRDQNKLGLNGNLHVNVLKIPHHGASDNMTKSFSRAITADHYVFCGNGFQDNPEEMVVETIIRSRIGSPGERSTNPEVGNKFKLWFNCSSTASDKYPGHMKMIEKLVKNFTAKSKGRMQYEFLDGHKFDLKV